MRYYLCGYPQVNEDGEEEYPEIVEKLDLSLKYYGEQFNDVVSLAFEQNPSATLDDVVNALNYYSKNDDFFNLD